MTGEKDIPDITAIVRIVHTLPVADVFSELATHPDGLTRFRS